MASKCPRRSWRGGEASEETIRPDGEVTRGVELEEKGFANLQGAELAVAARLPEVELVEVGPFAQVPVPAQVGDSHECFHDRLCLPSVACV